MLSLASPRLPQPACTIWAGGILEESIASNCIQQRACAVNVTAPAQVSRFCTSDLHKQIHYVRSGRWRV
jgi:hypothetical protein